ncbi:MAG: hypothetical protein HGN29_13730 [Asgard group archaeon]|nr:hypothetical protein [Asgard group archaeon]
MIPLIVLFSFFSYLYGSIPFALFFTYVLTKKNLLHEGTGNVGVINTFRTGGTLAGLLTVIGEISKAFVPLVISFFLFEKQLGASFFNFEDERWISLMYLFLTLLGINFSIFLRFRGGHGSTMTFFSTLILSPFSALTLLGINTILHFLSRYDFRIKRLWILFIPAIIYAFERSSIYASFGAATALLFLIQSGESRDDYVRHFEEYEMSKRKKLSIRFHKLSFYKRVPFIGNKANNLEFLISQKVKVPTTYALDWYMCSKLVDSDSEIKEKIIISIQKRISPTKSYAIRSSASIEDDPEFSFAGQFKTILNVQGIDKIINAIEEVYNSKKSKNVQKYITKSNLKYENLRMAVIVQEMVNQIFSGVSFGKNPITGLDEVVIEAVEGSGQLLLQDGITPFHCVYKWGEILTESKENPIPVEIIQIIAEETLRIQKKYKKPVDLEWVYDGKEINWVQVRPISTFIGLNIYSNKFSKEFLPGVIKPLIFSINILLINSTWIDILTELIGKNDLDPYLLAKLFYYRAYFNIGKFGQIFETVGFPRELLEILVLSEGENKKPKFKITFKTLRHLPRVVKFLINKLFFFEKRINRDLILLMNEFEKFENERLDNETPSKLLIIIKELFELNRKIAYFSIIIPLLNFFFNNRLTRKLKKYKLTMESLNYLLNSEQNLSDFNPHLHLEELHTEFKNLPDNIKTEIRKGSFEQFLEIPEITVFKKNVLNFIDRFGHLSDSGNDFSLIHWREKPKLILEMIINYTLPKSKIADSEILPIRKIKGKTLVKKIKRYRYYKEQISFEYTYSYSLFRSYFSALAKQFVQRGIFQEENDIYYLTFEEIIEIIEKDLWRESRQEQVDRIKKEIEKYSDIKAPATIYGDNPPPITLDTKIYHKYIGTPSSPGYYLGQITKVKSIDEFNKIQDGDVLVIPYSDVSWTPIFSKAGAVISEAGGMLSHCSIIAREYQIPAVVSVDGIFQLNDGDTVSVDGYKGEVSLVKRISKDH